MTGALLSAKSEESRAIILDNLHEEVRDCHPGMMRRFALAAGAVPTDSDALAVSRDLMNVRLFVGRLAGVRLILMMTFFEGFIQRFMAFLAELAERQCSVEKEYTDVHGVCDIAHTEGLFRALAAEMALDPSGCEGDMFEGVELLANLIRTIVHFDTGAKLGWRVAAGDSVGDHRGWQVKLGCLKNPLEQAGYLESGGAHLYSVLHGVADPIARVLLVGPFASERFASYVPWVRWARFLASRRIEALRFDYRGVGESTGVFEEMSFDDWNQDVNFLAGWLKSQSPDVPLILHGLELGALLASKTFAAGAGDALLLWSAPANANEVLRRPLSRHVFKNVYRAEAIVGLHPTVGSRTSLWRWRVINGPARLWRESFKFEAPIAQRRSCTDWARGRPVKVVKLDTVQRPS